MADGQFPERAQLLALRAVPAAGERRAGSARRLRPRPAPRRIAGRRARAARRDGAAVAAAAGRDIRGRPLGPPRRPVGAGAPPQAPPPHPPPPPPLRSADPPTPP